MVLDGGTEGSCASVDSVLHVCERYCGAVWQGSPDDSLLAVQLLLAHRFSARLCRIGP